MELWQLFEMAKAAKESRRAELLELINVAHAEPTEFAESLKPKAEVNGWKQLAELGGDAATIERIRTRELTNRLMGKTDA